MNPSPSLLKYWNLPTDSTDLDPSLWDPSLPKDRATLTAREKDRGRLVDAQAQRTRQDMPLSARALADIVDPVNAITGHQSMNPEWDGFFEAINEAGAGGKKASIGSAPGLQDDTQYGTLPLSLQNIPGAEYGYDSFGFPTSVTQRRNGRS